MEAFLIVYSRTQARKYRAGLLAAALLPLLLGIIFSYIIARQDVKRDLEATTQVILHQAETINGMAWDQVARLSSLKGKSCESVLNDLIRQGTLSAYFRSLGLMSGRDMYCSSVSGDQVIPLTQIIQSPLPAVQPERWSISVPRTRGVPSRPAIIFARQFSPTYGAFVIVDGQYLLDFMSAINNARPYQLTVEFNGGFRIQEGEKSQTLLPFISPLYHERASKRYPIIVSAEVQPVEILQDWLNDFLTFLPLSLFLSLIFIYIVRSWKKRKISLRDELRKGIQANEFSVHYQPLYDLESERCIGAEALLRWFRPGGSTISPDVFIPSAENEGLIIPLSKHLFKLLASDVSTWTLPQDFRLGINIAAAHIHHPDFVNDIHQLAKTLRHQRVQITLELTERSLISDTQDVIQKLTQLRSEGIRIAVDDFGTGHCSLSYLQMFPLDYLKIDKGFIGTIESAHRDTPVLDAIINLSHRLALRMVAEGVNSAYEYDYLKRCGVQLMQGYLYARPMSSEALMAWLKEQGQQKFIAAPETETA
ncbi:diguanylate phosphodiesterase [Lonsdalea populi]|uniref:cyclic-guanylate-specific phosphodiesterase n=1 Tax=Lonsdalea populi TaxID=1172565 RepID=A0A3N0UTD9_9GAMM|nr:diguanylate phosphodiesterase [Lonsdalea quercina]RAT30342.1 diguanylate phosphodiesterase [Lonsdalea populi]RAT36989.1 diguanylate phosphodiesterase [Lonsdalea populi]RAT48909.1 diguanylate phosphodiesterase [Lonsdalea populi]RAT51811.1 diguanylate phosphodiesterase [Lonsdalea populi]